MESDASVFDNNSRHGRRELLRAGVSLCASLVASSVLAQSSDTALRREAGTDAFGRRVGTLRARQTNPETDG
jgi:hypothetical protein